MPLDARQVDQNWLFAWLSGRAYARGLPQPFADRGGWRAEIGLETERRRWVFAELGIDLLALANEIDDPALRLRAIATPAAMRAFLPAGWIVADASYAMGEPGRRSPDPVLSSHYRLEVQSEPRSVHAFVLHDSGELAASGHGGIADSVFVYDRIVTQPGHRRRGLGRVIMHALGLHRGDPQLPGVLVATEAGRTLYEALGWQVLAPYASATWRGESPVQN